MTAKSLISLLLMFLGFAFFVWGALTYAGLPGDGWLLYGGLAAWIGAAILDRL